MPESPTDFDFASIVEELFRTQGGWVSSGRQDDAPLAKTPPKSNNENTFMFKPKTERIKKLAEKYPGRIAELETIFNTATNVYIDYANVRPWSEKLGWHIDAKRLKQFLDSFDTIGSIKFYQGTLAGDTESERFIKEVTDLGYEVKTKPVKIMRLPINVSSIPSNSPDILKSFIRMPLLKNLKLEQ